MLDAAAALLLDGGPGALSATAVAQRLSAPSGSVYHRFRSRDDLAAALWLRTVERFDADVVQQLHAEGDPLDVAVRAARGVVGWTVAHPVDAAVLTLFRRSDLIGAGRPDDVEQRARALARRQAGAVDQLANRLGRPADEVRFAVAGIPLAGVRPFLEQGRPVPAWVADAVERAARHVLAPTNEGSPP